MVKTIVGDDSNLPNSDSASNSANADDACTLDKLSFMDRLLIQSLPERFKVLATLGRGTYGNVYLALDQRLKREVAIKVLRPEWMTVENAKNRFLRESRAAARLNHSAIVRVIEADENSKIVWQVSDAIRGQSLATLLSREALEPKVAAKIVADLANAVSCAHSHGVVHRDIKPENVLLEFEGDSKRVSFVKLDDSLKLDEPSAISGENRLEDIKVFLTDFGLAKIQDEGIDQSGSTTLLGTPRYMAPEQFDLTGNRTLPSADIFALGAILFECLTGQSAFEGASTLAQRVALGLTHHPSPRNLKPALSRDLDIICLKALHPSACKRYASAAELADDLNCYLRGQPISARPQSATEKFLRLVNEHQSLAVVTTAIFVCLAVISIVSWQSQRDMQRQNAILERVNRELAAAKDRAEKLAEASMKLRGKAELDQQRFSESAWLAGVREAYRYWESSHLWESKAELSKLSISHPSASSRLDWKLLSTDLNQRFRELIKLDKSIEEVRAIHGTTKVAFVSANGRLYVYDFSCGQIVNEVPSEIPSLNALAVHPSKPYLYFGGVTYPNRHIASIYEYDLNTGETKEIASGFETTIESIDISHDGLNMLCASRYRDVRIYDLNTMSFQEFPADRRNLWLTQTNSPKKFVFQKEQTVLSIADTNPDSAMLDEIKIPRGIQFCVGVPGSSLIAVSFGSSEYFNLMDIETKRIIAFLRGEAINNIRCLYCSNDGKVLFCATESGTVTAWSLSTRDNLSNTTVTSYLDIDQDQVPTLNPIGSWHLADNPILSVALLNDRLICGTQGGQLLELNLAYLMPSTNYTFNSSDQEESLRELEVRLDSTCQHLCMRTIAGKVLIQELANDQTSVSNKTDSFKQLPLLPLESSKLFRAQNNVGGLYAGCSATFAFLRDQSTLQIIRGSEQVEVPINIESSDSLQILGVNGDCSSFAIGAARDIYIVDLNGASGTARKVASMDGTAWTVTWHPTEKQIVVGGDFPQLRSVDLETLEVSIASNTQTMSNLATYVDDGNAILSAHTEGSIRYSDLRTGTVQSISPHKCVIRSFTLSQDGTIGLSIDDESNVAVWKLPQLEKIGMLMKGRSHYERAAFVRPTIRLSEGDQQLVTVYNDDKQPVVQFRQLD